MYKYSDFKVFNLYENESVKLKGQLIDELNDFQHAVKKYGFKPNNRGVMLKEHGYDKHTDVNILESDYDVNNLFNYNHQDLSNKSYMTRVDLGKIADYIDIINRKNSPLLKCDSDLGYREIMNILKNFEREFYE